MREKFLQGFAVFFLAVVVQGCANKGESQVQPYGANRFIVTYGSIYGPSKSRVAAVRDANSYCSSLGSTMNPIDEQTTVGQISSVTLIFSCGVAPTSQLPSTSVSPDTRNPSRASDNSDENAILNNSTDSSGGSKIYRADECIGAVVNGVCHGSVIDTNPSRPHCYGTMIGGRCTGPQF